MMEHTIRKSAALGPDSVTIHSLAHQTGGEAESFYENMQKMGLEKTICRSWI